MIKIQSMKNKHQQKNKTHLPSQRRTSSSGNSNQSNFNYLQARMGYSAATQYIQAMIQQQTSARSRTQPPGLDHQGITNSSSSSTGLPDNLKAGIENLSGYSMDDVKVYYHSDKPAQLQANAYTQGTDIHLASGQDKHLPHEAWHVVQQKQRRVKPTIQMNNKVNINDDAGLEKEADVMGVKALQMRRKTDKNDAVTNTAVQKNNLKQNSGVVDNRSEAVVQRVVEGYRPGTLRKNTIVMRGLTEEQRAYVQKLHDDNEGNIFSVEDARAEAIEEKPGAADEDEKLADEMDTPNPYSWEVLKNAAFTSADLSIQSIVSNFGHPTQAVTAVYMNLGDRIAYEIKGKPTVQLSTKLVAEVYQLLDAQIPLHFAGNPFLKPAWQRNLQAYTGQKSGKSLYAVLRSKLTGDLREVTNSVANFDEILKAVSGRPPEVHHFLFKAIYGDEATTHLNLGLVERSPREKDYGPGQHELMHYIASGASNNKFKVLTQQFVNIYNQWVKDRYSTWLLAPL